MAGLVIAVVATLAVLPAGPAAPQSADQSHAAVYDATIRRDSYGVPHVLADDWASLAFGIGYAFAEDNLCTLMDYTVTVRGERSRWFGPDGTWTFGGNGTVNGNLDSDFHYAAVNDSGVLEDLLAQPAPHGPLPQIVDAVRGYAAGINEYLADIGGADGVTDPRCHGADWVRPVTEMDVYRRFFQLATMASSGVAIPGIGSARPPEAGLIPDIPGVTGQSAGSPVEVADAAPTDAMTAAIAADPDEAAVFAEQLEALAEAPERFAAGLGIGSNAVALGADATDNGMGMVLGNPHFPWDGGERLYQMQLTIPGKVNVSGAGLYGVPLVLIGHTDGVAWSHTVSTAYRFTPFELTLVPGDPTSYLVDGRPEKMTSQTLTVETLQADGTIRPVTRTLWSTRYGPMINSLMGLPLFPWTPLKAYAIRDANEQVRYLNQFFLWNQAQTAEEILDIATEYVSVPWVNTIAADRDGNALYSDVSVVPHVTDDKALGCTGVLGLVTFTALGLPTLDGSRSACDWGTDPDAPVTGIFGASNLPYLFRSDYVTNGNDSYWLSNPQEPLEGFDRIIGTERTERSLRTRLGLLMVQQRLAGTDGRSPAAGNVFTQDILQEVMFENRHYGAELMVDDLVTLCETLGGLAPSTSDVLVDTGDACRILDEWDRRDDLDSPGALLFRRFMAHLDPVALPIDVVGAVTGLIPDELLEALPLEHLPTITEPWLSGFDVNDPVNTPHTLNVLDPRVALALGDAVADLRGAGIPLDATLRDWQYEVKDGERIPIHGGPGGDGLFNAMQGVWHGSAGPDAGYSDIVHGASFVMAAHFVDPATNDGCGVDADAIVTYSQSEDSTSPHFSDQTRMFSDKQWNPMYFCEAELRADPGLVVTHVSNAAAAPAPQTPTPSPRGRLPATGGGDWHVLVGAGIAVLFVAARRRGPRSD